MRRMGETGASVVWEAELPPSVGALALPHGDVVVDPRQKQGAKKKKRPSL